jgi:hypothetical protein
MDSQDSLQLTSTFKQKIIIKACLGYLERSMVILLGKGSQVQISHFALLL